MLVLTFHPALHIVFDILESGHHHVQKSPSLKAVLPKPQRVAFRSPVTLRNKLVHSNLKLTDDTEQGKLLCGKWNCKSCNVLKPDKGFRSLVKEPKKKKKKKKKF